MKCAIYDDSVVLPPPRWKSFWIKDTYRSSAKKSRIRKTFYDFFYEFPEHSYFLIRLFFSHRRRPVVYKDYSDSVINGVYREASYGFITFSFLLFSPLLCTQTRIITL